MIQLEEARKDKLIGKGLEAELEVRVCNNFLEILRKNESGLKEILNVSKVSIVEDLSNTVVVHPATGHKCARCWNFMPEVSDYGIWQNVCTRCQGALKEMGIRPPQTTEEAK